MKLTPAFLRSTYAFVTSLPPFTSWTCPPADSLKFAVTKHRDRYADYSPGVLRVSEVHVGHPLTLIAAVAHEAIHAVQQLEGTESPSTDHNEDFKRKAARVCRAWGFDLKAFL
jgi:hypothetical protein